MYPISISRNPTDLGTQLLSFQQVKKFCDATVIVNGETIEVDANVLAVSSKYFEDKFEESNVKQIIFNNIDKRSLEKIIEYCYTGKIETTVKEIEGLIIIAQDLLIDTFIERSVEALKTNLNVANCLSIRKIAKSKNFENLRLDSLEFIKKNFVEVSRSQDFLDFTYEDINEFVNSNAFSSEMNVLEIVENWVNHDIESRSIYFAELLNQINLENLPIKIFLSKPSLLGKLGSDSLEKLDGTLKGQASHSKFGDPKPSTSYQEPENISGPTTLIAVGGNDALVSKIIEVYDKIKQEWVEIKALKISEKSFSAVLLDDKLMLVGGYNGKRTIQSYDLKTGRTTLLPSMKFARYEAATIMFMGDIYVIGGLNFVHSVAYVEKFNPKVRMWADVGFLKTARYGHGCAVLDDTIYVAGGYGKKQLASVESYDFITNKWKYCKSMCEERGHCSIAAFNGYLYAVGGHGKCYTTTAERYDPKVDVWILIQTMNVVTFVMAFIVHMDEFVTVGGLRPFKISALPVKENYDNNIQIWRAMPRLKNARSYFNLLEIPWDIAQLMISSRRRD